MFKKHHLFFSTIIKNLVGLCIFAFIWLVVLVLVNVYFQHLGLAGNIGVFVILFGNLFAYIIIALLYYWKSNRQDPGSTYFNVKRYFTNGELTLRPWTGYAEISIFSFFFLVRPEIIVGYLILRGITGYRGEQTPLHAQKGNPAEVFGELNAIKALGLFINIFIGICSAAFLRHSPAISSFLYEYFGWLTR